MDWTGVFAVRQIKAKEEFCKPTQHRHCSSELEYLCVCEMFGQLLMQLVSHISVEAGQHHLLTELQYCTVTWREHFSLDIVREGINLFCGEASLSRRDRIDLISKLATVSL